MSVIGMGAVMASSAPAFSQYSGELFGNVDLQGGGQPEPSGFVYGQAGWVAPTGTNFAAFGYTSGYFFSNTASPYGGISAGFGGDGTVTAPSLQFPGTMDCAIASNNGWTYNDFPAGTARSGWQTQCQSNGVTNGWTDFGHERSFSDPSTDPQVGWSKLYLDLFCESASGSCSSGDATAAVAQVSNLSAIVYDPNDKPSGSASWSGNSGTWVQTNSGNVSLNGSATDPAGVCAMNASISGPGDATITSGALGNQAPQLVNVGNWIGTELGSATDPCNVGQTDTGSWTVPGGLASGTWSGSIEAANPGNYQGQGYSANGSPIVASAGSINVDDQTPSLDAQGATGSGSWTTATTATINISTGPSGLSSVSCTDNGASVAATRVGANGDSFDYSVPLQPGSNSVRCSGANGDSNGALTGNSAPAVYQQDSSVPVITFSDGGYTAGTWTAVQQTVQIRAVGGPSGVSGLSCKLDGGSLPDSFGDTMSGVSTANGVQTATVTIPANGAHSLACSADNAGTPNVIGSGSYQVDVDTLVPKADFLTGAGYAPTSTQSSSPGTATGQNWISGASNVTIGVEGTEPAIVSGVKSITCTVNGYAGGVVILTNQPSSGTIAQATPFMASFTADKKYGFIDGQNEIDCSSTTPAGVQGANGASTGTVTTEFVDINDPNLPPTPGGLSRRPTVGTCGISSTIDQGNCAYSNGPDQKTWYATDQTVTITADDTGGAAPITSITCIGATMIKSSWTATVDGLDSTGLGMTVTATVTQAGGATIDCVASDSASPADTYDLGTYTFLIDDSKPAGVFEPQGYEGAAQNIIQLKLAANPSGIKQVTVQATDQNTGVLYTGAQLTSNPADGHTAYATWDANTQTWNLTVDPAVFPNVNDKIAFVATAMTGAGVSATISTTAAGLPEILTPGGHTPGGLGYTPPTPAIGSAMSTTAPRTTIGGAYALTGDSTLITATARSGHWTAAGIAQKTLNAALQSVGLQAKTSASIAPPWVGTVATWKHPVCNAPRRKHGEHRTRGEQGRPAPRRSCGTLMSHAPQSEALPASFNQKTEIAGRLTDTRTHKPVVGGSVAIYTVSLAANQVTLAHLEQSGRRGQFRYRLDAGPDRRIDLVYLGKPGVTQGADTAFDTTTAGKVRIHAVRVVRVGDRLKITGRLYGGAIGVKGVLVQSWFAIVGTREGWVPFSSGRTNHSGQFVIRYPIGRNDRGGTYRVRVNVPAQQGWGFRGTTSNVLRFRVE